MDTCTHCGAELGVGRFCTSCGRAVEGAADESWRTDTAERPRPTVPPVAPTPPTEPRFPLFADEALPEPETQALGAVPAEPTPHREDAPRRVAGWIPWVAGLAALAVIGSLGVWLLLGGERDDTSFLAQDTPTDTSPSDDSPLVTPDPEPTGSDTGAADPQPAAGAKDLAGSTTVKAPAAAPPGQDTDGNVVSFAAANMIDGDPETTWRTPGDASGKSITFRFGSRTVLSEVGLINGYAKVGRDRRGFLDWYAGNRRVQRVEWRFDDGTTVTQRLRESASMQVLRIDQVKTRKATVRLLEVSAPGGGRASRNYTAISDVRLVGVRR